MAYDNEFYRQYEEYLNEPVVSVSHGFAVQALADSYPNLFAFDNVIDLGCGLSESLRLIQPSRYLGIDLSVVTSGDFVKGDYRDLGFVTQLARSRETRSFVSFFSSEITAPAHENRTYYAELFERCPTLKAGLVSGFYYSDKKHLNPVRETGDIFSWQTLDSPETLAHPSYSEKRLVLHVPSKMFGPNVYEVWRLLERK